MHFRKINKIFIHKKTNFTVNAFRISHMSNATANSILNYEKEVVTARKPKLKIVLQ